MLWQESARCRGLPAEVFYLESDKDQTAVRKAKSICSTCPVILACRAAAHSGHEDGIWGGTTESERKHRRRRIA